jgi:hypothetical protein
MLQQFADAKHVVGIAYRNTTVQAIGTHDDTHARCRFRRIAPLGFGDQTALGHAVVHQVVEAYTPFTEFGVGGGASGRDHNWSGAVLEQFERMIEPGAQYRRRAPGIFRRAKHYDRIRWMNFLERSRAHNLYGSNAQRDRS